MVEVATGTAVREILERVGGPGAGWVLTGGLAGRWARIETLTGFSTAELAGVGAHRGVGSLVVLPPTGCLLSETARILDHLAAAGARQCGPCMFGLPAIAGDVRSLQAGDDQALERLQRRLPLISGRGACSHPDGAVMLAASALSRLLADPDDHLRQHLRHGPCPAPAVVPLGPLVVAG